MELRVDVRGFDEVQRELRRVGDEFKRGQAVSAALNKVADKARAEVTRQITARFNIGASLVRDSLYLRRAAAKGGRLTAILNIFGSPTKRGRSMNMIRFLAAVQAAGQAVKVRGARGNKKQLAALGQQLGFQITKGGGLKQIPGAFIGNNGRTVFIRNQNKTMNSRSGPLNKHNQAIEPVQVIGVSQMFRTRVIERAVMDKINADLGVEVKRAVDMVLARRG